MTSPGEAHSLPLVTIPCWGSLSATAWLCSQTVQLPICEVVATFELTKEAVT